MYEVYERGTFLCVSYYKLGHKSTLYTLDTYILPCELFMDN